MVGADGAQSVQLLNFARNLCMTETNTATTVLQRQQLAVRVKNTCVHCNECGTPCTPPLIVVVGHYAQSAAGGGGCGRRVAWQRSVGGTTVTTDRQ